MALQREQVVQTAEKYVSRGKIEPAIREYRKLLADNPNDINTLNRIGDLYARIQRIDEAVDFFTLIAEQYTTEGFFVKAIAIYKKIIKLDPTRLEVYEKLAELYHKQGLVNEARTQYQVLADYYQKHDNAPSAIAIYQKMADVEPNNPTYHVKLAEIYQQQQLTEKAVGEYKMIAELMLAHGRSQDAAQVYERALDVDSSNLGFINDAVLKLKESGNTAAAARFLSVAAERNPQAARIARLARVEEVEVEAEPATPVPPAAPPEPRFDAAETQFAMPVELPPAVEGPRAFAGEPAEEPGPATDLAAAMRAAEAATTAPHVAGPPSGEIELNLDEVFMLDMEDEAEPTSLVKPPPDMEAAGRLGSAWAHGQEAAEEVIAEAFGVEPAFTLEPEPRAAAEVEAEAELETELEAEPEVEAEVAEVEPAVELAPPAMDSFESIELPRDSEMLLALEPAELPNLDSASWKLEAEPRETAPRAIDADMLERTAAELHAPAERDEDLVSEAEVLAKYGLEEKALERLREALRLRPRNLEAYAVMIQIHLGRDRHDRVVQLANAMAQAAAETRDDAQIWPRTKKQLAAAGYRFDAQRLIAGPHGVVEPEPAPPVLEAPVPELPATEMLPAVELPELEPPPVAEAAEVSFPEPPAAFAPRAPAAPPTEAPARRRRSTGPDIDQMLRGLLDGEPRRPATRRAAAAAAAPVAPAEAPAPAPPPSGPPAGPPVLFNPLEIGEMIEREELDWQPAEPSPATPPSPAFQIPPPVVPGPPASGERRAHPGLDDTGGLSWLDEADHGRTPKSAGAQRLFDEEEDFFDLAAELEHELSQEDVFQTGDGLLMQPAEQSLEEIVEGFKKGVAEHLSPTDFDTHFNLGIAYREMGLLDEAIGEFQIAAKDPRHLVLCCSMLGLCFLDKGLPELAVKWYRRGLDTPGLNEEDMLGLLYDLGCAHLAVGDKDSAYKAFVDLYGINTNYRDVVARIEELGR